MTVTMFCRMGLETNIENTNTMVCTPVFVWGKWGRKAYKQQATGEGETLWGRERLRVSSTNCRLTLEQSSIKQHMAIQHSSCVPQTRGVDEKGEVPTTYVVSLPRVLQLVRCPVPGCPVVEHSERRLRESFMFQHIQSRIALVQKGKEPLP